MIHSCICLSSPFGAQGLETTSELKSKGLFIFNSPNALVGIYERINDVNFRMACEINLFSSAESNFPSMMFKEKLKEMIDSIMRKYFLFSIVLVLKL